MKATLIKENDFYYLVKDNKIIAEINGHPLKSITGKLSKQNCDEIFGVVDVEELAAKEIGMKMGGRVFNTHELSIFVKGFNKAIELNKDKQFTLEDIRMAIAYGEKHRDMDAGKVPYQTFVEFIPSLQQPTEIEVEVEMEEYGYCEGCRKAGMWHCAHADTCGYAETRQQPKLDSDGCLILKKIEQ
jgi:hypothetical protein